MRAGLVTAMKARDKDAVSALRATLAAFDDAEAVAVPEEIGPLPVSEHVAGGAVGLGAAEVARRELTVDDLRRILTAQVTERTAEAGRYESYEQFEAAARLRREADVLRRYLAG